VICFFSLFERPPTIADYVTFPFGLAISLQQIFLKILPKGYGIQSVLLMGTTYGTAGNLGNTWWEHTHNTSRNAVNTQITINK